MMKRNNRKRKSVSNMSVHNNNVASCQMTIDNSQNVLRTMHNLFQNSTMCDVHLKVANKVHSAHRLILCATSDVFQAMLMKPEWTEWNESKIELQELPECEPQFHNFLEYFYTGKILITHTNVMGILCLADKYIVKSLTWLCTDYMSKHIPHAASSNVLFSWLQYTLQCGHNQVAEKCLNYIKWNLESIANTPEFSEFDAELFVSLLQQNDIVVYNEMVLYNVVVRWLDLQKIHLVQSGLPKTETKLHMKHLVEVIMTYIRFPMMTPRELADLLLSPLIKENKEFFVDRMAIGMMYHSGQNVHLRKLCKSEDGRLLLTPRLYTCDRFNCKLLIENVLSLPDYHMNTFVFSTHISAAEHESDKLAEWMVDLYPKGVWFNKCFLIVWQGTLEVPEAKYNSLRLALTYRGDDVNILKVRIGILLYANDGWGCEYVINVIEKYFHFTGNDRVLNIENFISFDELTKNQSEYLVGNNFDQLKINLVITPICPNYGKAENGDEEEDETNSDPYSLID